MYKNWMTWNLVFSDSIVYSEAFHLRIAHIHDAKTLNIRPLWHVLLHYFITRPSIKNLYGTILTKSCICIPCICTILNHMWDLMVILPLWGLSLTAPVLLMAQKLKLSHLVFGRFYIVETHNDHNLHNLAYGKKTFLLMGNWYFCLQNWKLHGILASFHVSHIKIG